MKQTKCKPIVQWHDPIQFQSGFTPQYLSICCHSVVPIIGLCLEHFHMQKGPGRAQVSVTEL